MGDYCMENDGARRAEMAATWRDRSDLAALQAENARLRKVINSLCVVAVGYQQTPGYSLHPVLAGEIRQVERLVVEDKWTAEVNDQFSFGPME